MYAWCVSGFYSILLFWLSLKQFSLGIVLRFFLFFVFFLMGTILTSLWNVLQYCFCFRFWFFWLWGVWDLTSPVSDQTHTPRVGRRRLHHWATRKLLTGSVYHRHGNTASRLERAGERRSYREAGFARMDGRNLIASPSSSFSIFQPHWLVFYPWRRWTPSWPVFGNCFFSFHLEHSSASSMLPHPFPLVRNKLKRLYPPQRSFLRLPVLK